jgi:DNA-directed RNA polymerase specialized sigma24 family protein
MPEDIRSDEVLIAAYQAWLDGRPNGDPTALEILLTRYSTIILAFIGGKSFFYKDEPYLDDIRQEVLIKVFKGIKDFTSTGPGSFKRWVFRMGLSSFLCK